MRSCANDVKYIHPPLVLDFVIKNVCQTGAENTRWSTGLCGLTIPSKWLFPICNTSALTRIPAANPNVEFRFKFLLFVDRANYLVGIQHFDPLDRLNIPGRNLTLFVDVNCYRARFVVDRFKFYLLQIQHDVGYVLNDPGEGSKLVLRPSDPNGSNSSSFQRRQKNSAQRVANGVPIPCLKRFGDEFGIGFSCASLIFSAAFRHLETS